MAPLAKGIILHLNRPESAVSGAVRNVLTPRFLEPLEVMGGVGSRVSVCKEKCPLFVFIATDAPLCVLNHLLKVNISHRTPSPEGTDGGGV